MECTRCRWVWLGFSTWSNILFHVITVFLYSFLETIPNFVFQSKIKKKVSTFH